MVRKKFKIIILIVILIVMLVFTIKSYSASLTLSASNLNPTVGDTITITIGSGVGGKVSLSSSNPSVISVSSSIFIDYNSTSFTVKANSVGSATITATAVDLVSTDAEPVEITGSKSITIKVKEKQTTSNPDSSNSGEGSSSSNSGSNSSSSSSNSSKTNASNKPNTNKEAVKNVVQTEAEEEATPQFGMNSLILNAVNDNGEKQEITFNPTFNIDTYEYTTEVESNITDIEVVTEAGEYNDCVKVEKPETLSVGENIIKIIMQKDDMSLTYTIRVNKKEAETIETVSDGIVDSDNKEKTLITFTIPQFIAVFVAICLIEGVLLKLPWKKIIISCRRKKGFEDYDDEIVDDYKDEKEN